MKTDEEVEIDITEYALEMLIGELAEPYESNPSGNLHVCSVCGKQGMWGPSWTWFGSWIDAEEDWSRCRISCSRQCWETLMKGIASEKRKKSNHRRAAAAGGAVSYRATRRYL